MKNATEIKNSPLIFLYIFDIIYLENEKIDNMKEARKLGRNVEYLMNKKGLSTNVLSIILDCEENLFNSFLKGMVYFSYDRISKLASIFNVSVEELLNRNYTGYEEDEATEEVLNIIEHYTDVINAARED